MVHLRSHPALGLLTDNQVMLYPLAVQGLQPFPYGLYSCQYYNLIFFLVSE